MSFERQFHPTIAFKVVANLLLVLSYLTSVLNLTMRAILRKGVRAVMVLSNEYFGNNCRIEMD